jgi:hypothetical protein
MGWVPYHDLRIASAAASRPATRGTGASSEFMTHSVKPLTAHQINGMASSSHGTRPLARTRSRPGDVTGEASRAEKRDPHASPSSGQLRHALNKLRDLFRPTFCFRRRSRSLRYPVPRGPHWAPYRPAYTVQISLHQGVVVYPDQPTLTRVQAVPVSFATQRSSQRDERSERRSPAWREPAELPLSLRSPDPWVGCAHGRVKAGREPIRSGRCASAGTNYPPQCGSARARGTDPPREGLMRFGVGFLHSRPG